MSEKSWGIKAGTKGVGFAQLLKLEVVALVAKGKMEPLRAACWLQSWVR